MNYDIEYIHGKYQIHAKLYFTVKTHPFRESRVDNKIRENFIEHRTSEKLHSSLIFIVRRYGIQ